MRNMWELLRTRLHIDKCKEAIYKELTQNLEWWPAVSGMSVDAIVEHFSAQWEKVSDGQTAAKTRLFEFIESSSYESKEELLEAIGATIRQEKGEW